MKPQHVVAVVDPLDPNEGPWYCVGEKEAHATLVEAYACEEDRDAERARRGFRRSRLPSRDSDHMGGFLRASTCGASGSEHAGHPFRVIGKTDGAKQRVQYPCLCRDSRYVSESKLKPPTRPEMIPLARPRDRKPKACGCPPECKACRRVKIGETVCKHCESHKLNPAWDKSSLDHLHPNYRVCLEEPVKGRIYATGPGYDAPHTVGLPRWWP